MLPPESIRFVRLDPAWVECLVDGAFSVGRLTGRVRESDRGQSDTLAAHLATHPVITGFLLRSSVVPGWPGLLVDGYPRTDGGDKLPRLRFERLGPETLIVLYAGTVARVQVHQAPEAMHFGTETLTTTTWRGTDDVADLRALAQALKLKTSEVSAGTLAAKLVEGVSRVTFVNAG